jgi:hypothetical protein
VLPRSSPWLPVLVLACLAAAPARRGQFIEQPVDPLELRSPSGAWSILVDSELPAWRWTRDLTALSHGSEVVWTKDLPCTLRRGQIGDDGAFQACRSSTKACA